MKSPENIAPIKNSCHLEVIHRNILQATILEEIDEKERLKWLDNHAGKMSDIIDDPGQDGEKIRRLARSGQYKEAARVVKDIMGQD